MCAYYNASIGRWRQEEQKFKVILYYIWSLRSNNQRYMRSCVKTTTKPSQNNRQKKTMNKWQSLNFNLDLLDFNIHIIFLLSNSGISLPCLLSTKLQVYPMLSICILLTGQCYFKKKKSLFPPWQRTSPFAKIADITQVSAPAGSLGSVLTVVWTSCAFTFPGISFLIGTN